MKPPLHSGDYWHAGFLWSVRPSHRIQEFSWLVAGCCSWLKTEFGCLVVTDILWGQREFFWGQRVKECLQEKGTGLQNSFLHYLAHCRALNFSIFFKIYFSIGFHLSRVSLCSDMLGFIMLWYVWFLRVPYFLLISYFVRKILPTTTKKIIQLCKNSLLKYFPNHVKLNKKNVFNESESNISVNFCWVKVVRLKCWVSILWSENVGMTGDKIF